MTGLVLPADFPAAAHARTSAIVAARATATSGDAPSGGEALRQFESAWSACAHRFLSLARHDETFTSALRRGGRHPEPAELHVQEEALFGFVSTGVAVAESVGYALYAIAAMIHPDGFPLATPVDRRNATLGATMRGYSAEFAQEGITRVLFWRLNSHEFGWWKDVRALLAHRLVPSRWPEESGPEGSVLRGAWMLRGEQVDEETTGRRRAWLAQALGELVAETGAFAERRLGAG